MDPSRVNQAIVIEQETQGLIGSMHSFVNEVAHYNEIDDAKIKSFRVSLKILENIFKDFAIVHDNCFTEEE